MARRSSVRRALSIMELENTQFDGIDFDGQWKSAMGSPDRSGTILIYGPPKNGKTYFSLMFAKYLTRFGHVAYDALEMGTGLSLKMAIKKVGFNGDEKRKIVLLNRESITELNNRLEKKKSPAIVFIDSLQYTGLSYKQYIAFKERHRNKLITFISHADGKQPRGEVAKSIQYDADIIIRVEGFKAFPASRFGGGEPITVWDEGAEKYW